MEKLGCMFVRESKLSDLHLASSSLATATSCAIFSHEAISHNSDALVADLHQTIAAQR